MAESPRCNPASPDASVLPELENTSFAAWPAAEVETIGGWRVRYTGSVSRRANSVSPIVFDGTLALQTCIDQVEAFYDARHVPSLFQMSQAAAPAHLDATLEARGYGREAPTAVEAALASHIIAPIRQDITLSVQTQPSEDWFGLSAKSRFQDSQEEYAELLRRLQGRAIYVLASQRGVPASVGLGVVADGWLGVFSLFTDEPYLRQGFGAAVLSGLAQAACERNVNRVYLQVNVDNTAARALYRNRGFTEVYQYYYRRRSTQR